MSVTIGTGALATGVVAYAVVGSQAEGAALVNKTFELDGVTYSGAELVTLDVANDANVTAGGASHTISGVANMTVTLDIDGTLTDKKFTDGVHVLNSSGKGDSNRDYAIWADFCSSQAYYGQTLKLQGASAAWTLNLDFMPMSYGGLITEAASDAGSYRIGRTDGALNITANTAAGANMLINAATTLVSNGATVNTAGSWVLNKALTFASATTIAAEQEVSLSGAGNLYIDGALTMNAGSRITGAQNTLAINGSLALDVAGLSAGAEALISTAGEVRATGLTLNNASSLAAGEYQLIRTTNAAADAMSAQFSGDDRYSVINKDGVVTLMVRDRLVYSDGSGYSGGAVNNLSDAAVSRMEEVIYERNDAVHGGAVYNDASYSIVENGRVTFAYNSGSTAGAICNFADFRLNDNGVVYFGNNSALNSGGAIDNYVGFELNGNDSVTFSGNIANAVYSYGGAIFNYDMFGDNSETFSVEHNKEVTFSGNSASYGGAVYNQGNLRVLKNENVLFRGNSAATGAAVYNDEDSVFSLSGNTNVIFEKNAEFDGDSYRLRSIYSLGTLNLSATGSILFKDSVYASGTVNLNQDGTGDIIFTGASTEADLRSVKVGESGTAQEIADSRSSVLDAVVTLGGGTLQVRDAASLTVKNLTAAAGSELVLHNATFTTTGNTTLSAVTTSGNSTLSAEPGGIITLTQAITNNGTLTLSGTFNADALAEAEEGTASMNPCYINTSGENSESGFYSDSGRLTRYSLTSGTGILNAADAKVLNGGYEMSVDSNGVATDLVRIINYDKYYINGDSASLSAILAKSPSATVQMAGGTLTVDADCNAEIVHDDTASLVFSARQMGSRDFSQFASLIFEGISSVEGISSGYNGGAIDNGSSSSLSRNGSVTFSGNTASSLGGAIGNSSGTFTLSDNGDVTFIGNTASCGGAISNYYWGTFDLRENGDVTFIGNTASDRGGAIGNWNTFTLSDNENVTFSGNHVTSSGWSYGGAIDNHGSFTLFGNGSVTFAGNYITSSGSSNYSGSCYGGAIGNEYTFTLSGNGDVTFSGNTVSSSGNVYGGAIYNQAFFTLSGNGDVTFSGNTASSSSGKAYGGAIYNECFISGYDIDIFTLSGNGNVLFEKNAEVSNGIYRLRSIYSSKVTLNLSASEGKSILFKDSVYVSGTVNLNQEGTGDIIFTGASTIADLREVKGGIAGTVQEIANSRSSVLDATVTLGGGTLQVRDAASLTVKNLTAADGSELVLHNATFTTTGNTTLAAVSISGNSMLTAQDGATLTLTQAIANEGVLTLSGTINADALALERIDCSGYINTAGESATSGFADSTVSYSLALIEGRGSVNGTAATITHTSLPSDVTLTLDSNGVATATTTVGVDYSTYYINGDTASLSAILAKSPSATVQMAGGTLMVDRDLNTAIAHDNTASLVFSAGQTGSKEFSQFSTLVFEGSSSGYEGSAIGNYGTFTMSDNESVTICENYAEPTDYYSRSCGGAISNYGTFTMSSNGSVSFIENSASALMANGGAIYNEGTFTLNDNESVTFSRNSTNEGGAIFCDYSTFSVSGNGSVTFSENSASEGTGGAIYNFVKSTFSMRGNGSVTFSGNTAWQSGAINNCDTFTISGNGRVAFSRNSATGDDGGAILNSGPGDFSLSDNESVTFSGNSAASNGGAIDNYAGLFSLNENGNVTFIGNSAFLGGAIYNNSYGTFTLSGNADVLFEKNAEISSGVYRLRSIYSVGTLSLSASKDKSILFKDSVYAAGTVNLNQDGTGDIIFTGVSTEADLREVKGGIAGTAQEILNSRTSEIATNATLYGGRLIVEDEAILKVKSLSVAEGASVIVKNGTLALINGKATITTAEAAEKATIEGTSLGESSLVGADAEHRGVVEGAHIHLAEGTDFSLQHLVLGATTRITDDPATANLDDVTAELVMGVNATLTGSDMLMAGTSLEQSGNTGVTLTLSADASVLMLEATTFDSVTLTGSSLVLELAGMDVEMFNSAEWIAVSFTSGTAYATFDPSLAVTLSIEGICYEAGYTESGDDKPTKTYFRGGKEAAATPEPATATLSLLALAALAARRRRR